MKIIESEIQLCYIGPICILWIKRNWKTKYSNF